MTNIEDFKRATASIALDTGPIPLVERGQRRVDYLNVERRARALDLDMAEVTSLALSMAQAHGDGVEGATTRHYLHAIVALDRARRGPEQPGSRTVAAILDLLDDDAYAT